MQCRYCGCTDRSACPEGCQWFRPEVCTRCIDDYVEDIYEDRNLAGLGAITALRAIKQIQDSPKHHIGTEWDVDLGWRDDLDEDGWAIVWATLPAGEVSWHVPEELVPDWLPEKEGNYDGYDRDEKNDRLRDWIYGGDT